MATEKISAAKLASMIDHTFLKPFGTPQDIENLCVEAIKYSFVAVCVHPGEIEAAAKWLERHPTLIATVIGFPLGQNRAAVKEYEAKDAIQTWVDEGTPYGAEVTYTADISQIIQARCATCHTTSSFGGVNLNTYTSAAQNAVNALAQVLSENMPRSGGPLENDQKDLWQVWVDDGTPE